MKKKSKIGLFIGLIIASIAGIVGIKHGTKDKPKTDTAIIKPIDTIPLPNGKDSIVYDTVKPDGIKQRLAEAMPLLASNDPVIITDWIDVPLTNNPETNSEILQNILDNSPNYSNIKLPKGDYAFSKTILINKPVQVYGYSMGSTVLHFYNNSGGIKVGNRVNSTIKNLTIVADQINLSNPTNGLEISSIVNVENVATKYFSGHGVYIHAGVPESDASMSSFRNVFAKENRKCGFYMEGQDANGMAFYNCNAMDNYEIGFYDNSFLGNSFFACMGHANIKGNYRVEHSGVKRATFFGCYSENPSNGVKDFFGSVSYLFGGTWGESGDSYELHDHSKAFND